MMDWQDVGQDTLMAWVGDEMFSIAPNEYVSDVSPAPWSLCFHDLESVTVDVDTGDSPRALHIGDYWSVDEAKSAAESAREDKEQQRGLWTWVELPPNWPLKGDGQ